jgi:hypothetical protein
MDKNFDVMSILKKIFEYIGLFLLLVLAIAIGTLIAYVVWISIHPQPAWYGWQGHYHSSHQHKVLRSHVIPNFKIDIV